MFIFKDYWKRARLITSLNFFVNQPEKNLNLKLIFQYRGVNRYTAEWAGFNIHVSILFQPKCIWINITTLYILLLLLYVLSVVFLSFSICHLFNVFYLSSYILSISICNLFNVFFLSSNYPFLSVIFLTFFISRLTILFYLSSY